MAKYAANTSVSSANSRAEIEKTLSRYGADQFLYGWQEESAVVGFRMNGRQIKFMLDMPSRTDKDIVMTPSGRKRRSENQIEAAYEQSVRQKWRALALVIKAKLEAVESGITEFDAEFLAHIVTPDGMTVGYHMIPQINSMYVDGKMPKLLNA